MASDSSHDRVKKIIQVIEIPEPTDIVRRILLVE